MRRIPDIRFIVVLLTVWLLVGCSGHEDVPEDPVNEPGSPLKLVSGTRTAGDEGDVTSSVHVYIVSKTDQTITEGDFVKGATEWTSTANVNAGIDYWIYGFAPKDAGTSASYVKLEGASTYDNGIRLSVNGIAPISGQDVSLVAGVRQVDTEAEATADIAITDGSYDYSGRTFGNNFVCLLMKRVFSCIAIRAKVTEEYSQMRTIKIKGMRLKAYYGSVNMAANIRNSRAMASGDISFSSPAAAATPITIELFSATAGDDFKTLTTDDMAEDICQGYLAASLPDVILETTYNIYDTEGNLVREDCKAENKLSLSALGVGQRQIITLTVDPTYLYQLSEPDADNPNVKISTTVTP
mgnify:CR=1 FL=1